MKKNIIIVKGNPKFRIPGLSEKFYKELDNTVKPYGKIKKIESDVTSTSIAKLIKNKNDVIIGFSRGCGYKPQLQNYFNIKNKYIGIGCSKNDVVDYQIKNPKDKTPEDMSRNSLKNHWTITKEMKKELVKILKNLNKGSI